jgi:hypothetical protein
MNGQPAAPAVAVKILLPVFSVEDAESRGMVPITRDVSLHTEPEIFASIQSALSSCRSCWIVVGKGVFQAARVKSELWSGS